MQVVCRLFGHRILFALVTLFSFACSVSNKTEPVAANKISMDSLANNFYEDYVKFYPIEATYFGDNRYNDQFPNNITAEYRNQLRDFYSKYQAELKTFDYANLSENDKMTYDVLLWQCDEQLKALTYHEHLMPVNQFSSYNLYFGDLASGSAAQPFKTVKDYNAWLSRVDDYLAWCDTAIVNMRKGVKVGYVLPKALVEKTIAQWSSMTSGPVEDHLFYMPIKNIPSEFSQADKAMLTTSYKDMIEKKLIPTYKKVQEFLETEYLSAARQTSGISGVPSGKDYYNFLVISNTTIDITPDSVFKLGESEVARILKETETIKEQVGYKGDINSFFNELRTKKELTPYDKPEQVIANFNRIHERMKPNLEKLFKNTPKTPFEIRRTPAFREASSSAEYFIGSEDGSRPGIFYVPIPDVEKYNVMRDEDLFLHEAIPGHHYQLSLQLENKSIPKIRKMIVSGAYAEGWALYTESLGKELGLYTDPYQYLGMLGGEMHRAIRLVVDAGMHSKGWTREQAIEYSKKHESLPEQSIIQEVERYMAIPGQALSYKIGQLKIRELRARAEKALGNKFDIADFHDQILNAGSLPLTVLEKKIDRWIASKK